MADAQAAVRSIVEAGGPRGLQERSAEVDASGAGARGGAGVGPISVLVNNAGPFADAPFSTWRRRPGTA